MEASPRTLSLDESIVIADAARSPLGRADGNGALARIRPAELLAQVVAATLDRTRLKPSEVTRVLIAGGSDYEPLAREACRLAGVAPADLQAPSRSYDSAQSILHAGVRATGRRDVVLVLGATKPDRARPWLRSGRRAVRAELVAARWGLDQPLLDRYARRSRQRALEVAAAGEFAPEIVHAIAWTPESASAIAADETIDCRRASGDTRALSDEPTVACSYPSPGHHLNPGLNPGTVSRSVIGAAAAVLLREDHAADLGLRPRARILALAESPHDADSWTCGPIEATRALLARTGIEPDQLDHCEIAEAFASIPVAWRHEFSADPDRFNPRGGSLGLGHAGSADGLRSLATLVSALEATGGRLGLQASEGSGSAGDALLVERIPMPGAPHPAMQGR
jgi:acetyl-CoA C-acetyltransferase